MDNPIVLTTVVLGIVQACKIAGVPARFSPLLAVVVGVLTIFALEGVTPYGALQGVVIGLSAVGLYASGTQIGDTMKK